MPAPHAPSRRLLLAVAAPKEGEAVLRAFDADPALADVPWRLHHLRAGFDLVVTGVGKANAAGAVARVFDASAHRGVINLGVAGSLPGGGCAIGDAVLAVPTLFADEGLAGPDGFVNLPEIGFPIALGPGAGVTFDPDPALAAALRPHANAAGPVATLSACSGTDDGAAAIARRTGAVAEAMEGAAIACVCARLAESSGAAPAPFCELRVISNTTGDRASQRWDLRAALARLGAICRTVRG